MPVLTNFFPGQEGMTVVAMINLLFTIGIPLVAMVLLIVRVVFQRRIGRGWAVGLGAFWLINAISLGGIGGTLAQDFVTEDQYSQAVDLNATLNADTIRLSHYDWDNDDIKVFRFGDEKIHLPGAEVEFAIQKSKDQDWHLEKTVSARGRRNASALELARETNLPLKISNGHIEAPKEIPFGELSKWRNQKAILTLSVPEGAYVIIEKDVCRYSRGRLPLRKHEHGKHLYQMDADGQLTCLDCTNVDENRTTEHTTEQTPNNMASLENASFTAIEMRGPIRATIEQGDDYSIRVDGNNSQMRRFNQEQIDNKLHLVFDQDGGSPIRVFVTMPTINDLKLVGTDDILIKEFEGEELSIYCESKNSVKADVVVDKLMVELLNVAEFEFIGDAQHLDAKLHEVSRMDTDRGDVATATLDLKNQSRAKLNSDVQILEQNISPGSKLRLVD